MTKMLTPEAERWIRGIAATIIAALVIAGVTWTFRFAGLIDTRLTRIESSLEVSPTVDSLQRIKALETRVDAFERGGARWSRDDAMGQAVQIRRELADLEIEIRAEIERLRQRVDRLYDHAEGA